MVLKQHSEAIGHSVLRRIYPNYQVHFISWKNTENSSEHRQNDRILHCECTHKTGWVLEYSTNEKKFLCTVSKDKKRYLLTNRDVSWLRRSEKSQNTTLIYNEEIKYPCTGKEQFDCFGQNSPEHLFNYVNPVIFSHKLLSSFCPLCFA